MKIPQRSQSSSLIDAKGVASDGETPLDQVLRSTPSCIRSFDNRA